jgi:hypothetical protein
MSARGDAMWLLNTIQESSATNDEKLSIALTFVGFVDEWTPRDPRLVRELWGIVNEWPCDRHAAELPCAHCGQGALPGI